MNSKFFFSKAPCRLPVIRRCFSRVPVFFPDSSLLSIQEDSYARFVGSDGEEGALSLALRKFFPIFSSSRSIELRYISCTFGKSRFSPEECIKRELTYSVPIFATFQLIAQVDGEEVVREQEIYMGELPCMVRGGSFIVNGVERVMVSQIHRSPGVVFGVDSVRDARASYYAKIIPYRGSWIDFEVSKGVIYSRIDKKRKLCVSTIFSCLNGLLKVHHLRDLGVFKGSFRFLSGDVVGDDHVVDLDKFKVLGLFYGVKSVSAVESGWKISADFASFVRCVPDVDIIDESSGRLLFSRARMIDSAVVLACEKDYQSVVLSDLAILRSYLVADVFSPLTGERLGAAGDVISDDLLKNIRQNNVKNFDIIFAFEVNRSRYIFDTVMADKNHSPVDAMCDVYRAIRPGDTPSVEGARSFFFGLFFDSHRYDLTPVGRAKLNERLNLSVSEDIRVLTPVCLIKVVKVLISIINGEGCIDDIDSLLCRRVRSVGELFINQCVSGLGRVEKGIIDALGSADVKTVMPSDLVGVRCFDFREYFLSNQLSQFGEATNPLSVLSHRRRLSAFGQGAISKDRTAGVEARDVHFTQYGRICPIETPEGSNLGLVASLAMFATVNKHGFLQTPYRVVKDGVVTSEIVYLTAGQELGHKIAQASDVSGNHFVKSVLIVRYDGDYIAVPVSEITLCDISTVQGFSVSTALIPFVEKDDAHRALMGSNMQRQAVPLINPKEPIVGTGWEGIVARQSGAVILARSNGVVIKADASVIVVRRCSDFGLDVYNLRKFNRSNAGTCINQRPSVRVGDVVECGDVLSDGPSVRGGEMALGNDVTVAFLSFFGRNFEDSVVVSQAVADKYMSIHLVDCVCKVMDAKGVAEEVTRNIPNISADKLSQLDEFGLVYMGSNVSSGDILVGKVSRSVVDQRMSPEEKLLRAIFGDVALNVKDVSLRVPIGIRNATVVGMEFSIKRGSEKDASVLLMERRRIDDLEREFFSNCEFLLMGIRSFFGGLIGDGEVLLFNGSRLASFNDLSVCVSFDDLCNISSSNMVINQKIQNVVDFYKNEMNLLHSKFESDCDSVVRGDDLPSGTIKTIKVTLAVKRPLRAGDKMAGRHGNKGVVSCVLPVEDMPFLADGTPIDVVLTPVGVPSRMNIGQIAETVLGWVASKIGQVVTKMLVDIAMYDDRMANGVSFNSEMGGDFGVVDEDGFDGDINNASFDTAVDEEEVGCDMSASDGFDEKLRELRGFLGKLYGCNVIKNARYFDNFDVNSMSDDDVLKLAVSIADGMRIASPMFDGATDEDIQELAKLVGLNDTGKYDVFDGRTGEKFDRPVTVGKMYYLKLHHLVEDKWHARSIGPYSLVTQQPLGGKAQFGGQRLGEMEVWALEAYGASYTLQEMLGGKSDSIEGRGRLFSSIVDGHLPDPSSGSPSAFQVLVREKMALCIDVNLIKIRSDEDLPDYMKSFGESVKNFGEIAVTDDVDHAFDVVKEILSDDDGPSDNIVGQSLQNFDIVVDDDVED